MEQGFSGQPPLQSETIQRIVDAVDDYDSRDIFIAANGVKLKLRKVSGVLVMNAINSVKPPDVPKFWDETAQRERENPMDPVYLQGLEDTNVQRGILTNTLYLGMGTRLVGDLPPDIESPDSKQWVDDISELTNGGVQIKSDGRARFAAWLQYIVLRDDEVQELILKIQRFSGTVAEADASQAVNSFPSNNGEERNPVIRIHPSSEVEGGSDL